MSTCQFCNTELKNLSSLNLHQKTAKYCLKLQKQKPTEEFQCSACLKNFSNKYNFSIHISTCKEFSKKKVEDLLHIQLIEKDSQLAFKDSIISKLEDQIIHLNQTIERLADTAIRRPTTQHNTKQVINLAPFDLTPEKAKIAFETKYTIEHFLDGAKGLARFVSDNLIKNENGEQIYSCGDRSRGSFKYANEKGTLIRDIKAERMVAIIHPLAKEYSQNMADRFLADHYALLKSCDDFDTVEVSRIRLDKAMESRFFNKYLDTELDVFSRELGNLL